MDADSELIAAVGRLGDRPAVRSGTVGLDLELRIDLVAQLEAELEIWRFIDGATSGFTPRARVDANLEPFFKREFEGC